MPFTTQEHFTTIFQCQEHGFANQIKPIEAIYTVLNVRLCFCCFEKKSTHLFCLRMPTSRNTHTLKCSASACVYNSGISSLIKLLTNFFPIYDQKCLSSVLRLSGINLFWEKCNIFQFTTRVFFIVK